MKKVLIIRFSSIGDIVLTTPVIRALHDQIKGAEIHFATKKAYAPVLSDNPYIRKLHLLDHDFDAFKKPLKTESFDFVVDLHNNLRSLRLKKYLRKPSRAFQKLNLQKWLLVNFKMDRLPARHIVERYLEAAAPLGVHYDGNGLDFYIHPESEVNEAIYPDHLRQSLVNNSFTALVIGAGHATKRLPVARLTRLAGMLKGPLVLFGGEQDRAAGDRINSAFPEKSWNACGVLSIQQSASLLRKARCVITPDTGLMHIASALDKPILSLWGNTIPGFGMTPFFASDSQGSRHSTIMEVNDLPCRPCSKIGYDSCPKSHFKCMQLIDLGQIVQWAESFTPSDS